MGEMEDIIEQESVREKRRSILRRFERGKKVLTFLVVVYKQIFDCSLINGSSKVDIVMAIKS